MTDEEVKKGLECRLSLRQNNDMCDKCPYTNDCFGLDEDALALIKRLEEENKILKEQCDDVRLYSLDMNNGKIDMTLGSENSKAFIHSIIQLFKQNGGKNFIAIEIEVGEKFGDRYVLTIEKVGMEKHKDKIRKETAKEILMKLIKWEKRETPLMADIQELAAEYGIEVEVYQ